MSRYWLNPQVLEALWEHGTARVGRAQGATFTLLMYIAATCEAGAIIAIPRESYKDHILCMWKEYCPHIPVPRFVTAAEQLRGSSKPVFFDAGGSPEWLYDFLQKLGGFRLLMGGVV